MATSVTFGVQPRRAAVGATFQATPNSFPYSRDQWPALITGGAGDLSANFFQLLNQIPAEWCWIYSAAQALMVSQSLDGNQQIVLLPDVCPVANGIPLNMPEPLEVGLQWIQSIGLPPASVAPSGVSPIGLGSHLSSVSQLQSDWRTRCVKGFQPFDLPDLDHMVSALLRGMPVVGVVYWDNDPNQAHALCCLTVDLQGGATDDNSVFLSGPNSWGAQNLPASVFNHPSKVGWFRIPLSAWQVGRFGAWCIANAGFDPANP